MPTPWDVAVHEASHALLAAIYRKPVTRVSVVPAGQSLGHATISNLNDWAGIDHGDGMNPAANKKINHRQRRTLRILVAGDVGNNVDSGAILVSQRLPAHVLQDLAANQAAASAALHDMADLTRALVLAIELPREANEELIHGEARARYLLQRQWAKVLKLAERLERRGMIEGYELQSLLR